jgi:hypothetical protein
MAQLPGPAGPDPAPYPIRIPHESILPAVMLRGLFCRHAGHGRPWALQHQFQARSPTPVTRYGPLFPCTGLKLLPIDELTNRPYRHIVETLCYNLLRS